MLETLYGQDPVVTREWLAQEGLHWVERHRRNRGTLGDLATFWEERAAATVSLLQGIGVNVTEVV